MRVVSKYTVIAKLTKTSYQRVAGCISRGMRRKALVHSMEKASAGMPCSVLVATLQRKHKDAWKSSKPLCALSDSGPGQASGNLKETAPPPPPKKAMYG